MAIPKLKVQLDSAQSRIYRDRISTLVTANDWDKRYMNNTYIDPITKTAMLCPAPRLPQWNTSSTGIYTRFKKSDYILSSDKWKNSDHSFVGDTYLYGTDESGNPDEVVTTAVKLPINSGIYLNWYAANSSSEDWVQMECGFSIDSGDTNTSVISLRIRSGGSVEVWEDDVIAGNYNISGGDGVPQSTANTYTDLLIIPFRKRELLVFSNRGGGFSHIIESIPESDNDPTIIPAAHFWWYVAPPSAAYVQCAAIKYPTSGYIAGTKSYLQYPPLTGEVAEHSLYGDANGGSITAQLVMPNGINTDFVPNDLASECRVKINLEGNSIISPNVYAVHTFYPALTALTDASQSVELIDYIVSASLDVSDSPDGTSFRMELKNSEEVSTQGGIDRLIQSISNRPISINLDSSPIQQLIDGQTEAPSFVKSLDDTSDRLSIDVRDRWKIFETYTFTDPVPLDGTNLSTAFRFLCECAGLTSADYDIASIDFNIPDVQNPEDGEFSAMIEVGDSIADWLNRLKDSYYPTLFMGFVPLATGIKFVIKTPEQLDLEASTRLFTTFEDAKQYLTDHTIDMALIRRYIIKSYSQYILEPEANDIWITGRDIRTGLPIQAHKPDLESQDPTIPPADRPQNWLGEIRKYAYYEPAITTEAALEEVTELMFNKLTPIRVIIEFEADMMFKADGSPIWRGDAVWIDGYGGYRITSLSTDFVKEPNGTNNWLSRPTRYTAEQVLDIEEPK